MRNSDFIKALDLLENFRGDSLKDSLYDIEESLIGLTKISLAKRLKRKNANLQALDAALFIKDISSQISIYIHSLGILTTLPKILLKDERILSLSLGAGNTGKNFDLETNKRIAEFKFIHWRKSSNTIRENSIFKDFYCLGEEPVRKKKILYLIGLDEALKFLTGGRAIGSITSRNTKLANDFRKKFGKRFKTVGEYYKYRSRKVELVDLRTVSKSFKIYTD